MRRLSHVEYHNSLVDLFPNSTIARTNLPPDGRPAGYDNDVFALDTSSLLLESYVLAAQSVSASVLTEALQKAGCSNDKATCSAVFPKYWALRLFRRPPADEVVAQLKSYFSLPSLTLKEAATVALEAMLLSPEFLYRREFQREDMPMADPYSVAARLSFAIWNSAPDDALLQDAENDALKTVEQVKTHTQRMLKDPRARRAMRHFYAQWLDLDRLDKISKSASDAYNDSLRESMKRETLDLLEYLTFDKKGTVTDILSTTESFIDKNLAALYDISAPEDDFSLVDFAALGKPERKGILTHASFLASRSHPDKASLVKRGVFVLGGVLCQPPSPPPPGASGTPLESPLAKTTRELYDAVTLTSANCSGCHRSINAAGYPFENFDTMGRFVTHQGDTAIDASTTMFGQKFFDVSSFVDAISKKPEAATCLVKNFQHFVYGRASVRDNACLIREVSQAFDAHHAQLESLVMSTVVNSAFMEYVP